MKQFKNMLAKFAKNLRKESNEKKALGKFDLILSLRSNRRPRKATQDESEIQKILSKIAYDSEFLKILTEKPQVLAEKFDLDKDDIVALKAADLLVSAQLVNPLLHQSGGGTSQQSEGGTAATIYFPDGTITGNLPDTGTCTVTTDTGSTCTVTNNGSIVSFASTVESLKDMDSIYLSGVIQRLVEDEEFYQEVRSYFGIQ